VPARGDLAAVGKGLERAQVCGRPHRDAGAGEDDETALSLCRDERLRESDVARSIHSVHEPDRTDTPATSRSGYRSKALFEKTSSRLTCWVREKEASKRLNKVPIVEEGSNLRGDVGAYGGRRVGDIIGNFRPAIDHGDDVFEVVAPWDQPRSSLRSRAASSRSAVCRSRARPSRSTSMSAISS